MSEELYSVEHAAERLKLHPKTVLRFIRDGRLKATRVGKAYRILRSDLDALAGAPPRARDGARVTTIVDVPNIEAGQAERLARTLVAVRMGNRAQPDPMSIDVVHDPARGHVKVIIVGAPADVAGMLRLIDAHLQP